MSIDSTQLSKYLIMNKILIEKKLSKKKKSMKAVYLNIKTLIFTLDDTDDGIIT